MATLDPSLTAWIDAAQNELRDLVLREVPSGLSLEWGSRRVIVPADRIRSFTPSELEDEDAPYLDLGTGTLWVAEDELLIRVQVKPTRRGLTAYLAAILAKTLLPRLPGDWQTEPELLLLEGKQSLLRREWARELSTDISAMAMSRLLTALRQAGLLEARPRSMAEIPLTPALELVQASFRLSSLGRSETYFFDPADPAPLLERFGQSCAWGTPFVLSQLKGGYVTPPELLVEPGQMRALQELLGPPVKPGRSKTLSVRPLSRAPLALLTESLPAGSTTRALNPILAACDGMSSKEPVRRQLSTELWQSWLEP